VKAATEDSKKEDEDTLAIKLNFMSEKLAMVTAFVKELGASLKIVQKEYLRIKKNHATALTSAQGSRRGLRRKKTTGQQKPPCQGNISSAMSDFLGVPSDHMMSRRDVIRGLNAYIKDKSLQSPNDGRIIIPDVQLKTLLDIPSDIDLTYFNMQKYINPHFSAVVSKNSDQGTSSATAATDVTTE
jgi:chromatin remodeling complex protein RSC6